jgi:hypothetical protein
LVAIERVIEAFKESASKLAHSEASFGRDFQNNAALGESPGSRAIKFLPLPIE